MALKLEPLRLAGLSNMEAGQLIIRHLSDLATIDPTLLTDAPFNTYLQTLADQSGLFEKGLAQVRKNEETQKIELADADRDKADAAFGRALKLYSMSDDPAEVEASRALSILLNSFKNLPALSYEAQTIATDKLVSDLEGEHYSPKVSLLQMDRYVTRLKNTNDNFKPIFGGRMVTTATTESYDLKVIRSEMGIKYSEFAAYVLSMAKALETPLFVQALGLLNTARKYYADLLARRTAINDKKAEPAAQ
ncbi:MAG: DUF6261 family protein [Prolixibacteraceae bacterium]|jgi:hypothetical protein